MKTANLKLKIVFFATPDFVLPVLKTLKQNHEIVGIVTTPDTLQGHKKILTPTPVKKYAQENIQQAKIFTPGKLTTEFSEKIKSLKPDLFVVGAYGKIIPQELLKIPPLGAINIHPSLLPKYRGPSPIQATILHGDTTGGVSLIQMDAEVDHGPLLAQEKLTITPQDNFVSLHQRMFAKAAEMLISTIEKIINKTITPQDQDHTKATFCPHITKKDGYFSLADPPEPEILNRMLRAYYPWPTAWTYFKTNKGEEKILKFLPDKKVQPEGKKPMSHKEFFNGYPQMEETLKKLFGN